MGPLLIGVVGWSITIVGWLMSALVSKAVTMMLEETARRLDRLKELDALLTSAHRLHTDNSSLKEMVQELQQLVYEAENLLDEKDYYRLEHQIQKKASSSSGFWCTYHFILSHGNVSGYVKRFDLSRRMKKLDKKLQKSEAEVRIAIETELKVTTQNTERSQTEATKLPQTTQFLTEPIYGRIQELNQLMNLLKNEKPAKVGEVPIVAIVGSGGVGKTSLARQFFHDPKVSEHFQANRFWICVSSHFDTDRLTREVQELACRNISDKRSNFLLVLDDMWEYKKQHEWDEIIAPFRNRMVKRSIILVTTTRESVAKMVNARDILPLKGLGTDEFLPFLSICILKNENYGGDRRLRMIGKEIADKLKGNPLAAKTVAAMLVGKSREVWSWKKILDNEEWIYQRGLNDIMPKLEVSYKHLPIHLQRCFSYCAMLPEDHTFTCEELVYLWMAQGFLNVRSESKTMEDIGSDYFNDLLNCGFFQSKPLEHGCLVHYTFPDHLLHRFARMVSIKECLRIDDAEQTRKIPPTIRHLSIFNCIKRRGREIGSALADLKRKNLSTIVNWDMLPSDTFQCICDLVKKTQFLRAMRITLCSQVEHINLNFQNFVSLRYLRLVMPSCYTLPKEICRLYHLEVFEIKNKLRELPNNFSDLVSLRHFIVEEKLHSKICGVGNLTSLQELNYFHVQKNIGFEIEQLGSLKDIGGSLQISNLENVKSKEEASKARLAMKENLDVLYLKWTPGEQETESVLEGLEPNTNFKSLIIDGYESVLEGLRPNTNLKSLTIDGYGGVASPMWLDPSLTDLESLTLMNCEAAPDLSLTDLKSLTLMNCKEWELLPPIGEFKFLEYLKLSGMPYLKKWVGRDQIFLFLEKITIEGCSNLVDLPLSGCSTSEVWKMFPSLVSLKIEDCPLISLLPPLPSSSLPSSISIAGAGFITLIIYEKELHNLSVTQDKLDELLAFRLHSSLHSLELSCISSLKILDLHSFVALEKLYITGCQSLTSITFGDHLVCLKILNIISCKTLSSMKGLKSWVKLECLYFCDCPSFVAAWDSASKEIESTVPNFSLCLTTIYGDSLELTLPICKLLTSLRIFDVEISAFTEEDEISPQLLPSIKSFPFDCFPSLESVKIKIPRIQELSLGSRIEIPEECLKIRNIEQVHILDSPAQIKLRITQRKGYPS